MKIGIFGTGVAGRTLAEKLAADGNEVMIGTRDVAATLQKGQDASGKQSYQAWQEEHPSVKLATFADTAKFGEIIFIVTYGNAAIAAIDLADVNSFTDKVVIDTTNPLDISKGIPPLFTATPGNSLGEQIQQHLPRAKVVKAFNTLGMPIIVNPQRAEGDPVLLIAGNDESAKKVVSSIAKSWGWKDVVDYGDIGESFYLEAFAMLWIRYAFNHKSWTHAFSFLRK
ncbi:NADPH-dependent F420 reductase [Chitinophaga sp. Hz27]|uniref:NADPH-dependent F420 reductase n=1 Tax=Chitinophaga sp. Hz27 TaxID=3347169 RepID=UPI0035E0EC42